MKGESKYLLEQIYHKCLDPLLLSAPKLSRSIRRQIGGEKDEDGKTIDDTCV